MTVKEFLFLPFVKSLWISLGIVIVFLIFRKLLVKIVMGILGKVTKKTKSDLDDRFVEILRKPARILMTFTVLFIAFRLLDFEGLFATTTISKMHQVSTLLFRSLVIILIFNVIYQMTDKSHLLFDEFFKIFDVEVDPLLVPFVSKIIRLLLFFITVAIVSSEWGFDVNGFVAGLGIGGLAFALAAQDTLSNTFGGAVILTEKPFTIGDWIVVNDVEGTVEDINFRSTKIRKFDKSIVTVPNSTVAKSNIINYSKRDIRRISYNLKVKMNTPLTSMKAIVDGIKEMLIDHPGINNETIFVHFNDLGESSYDVFLYFFTDTSVWSEYLALKEDTNFKILEILDRHDVALAVPLKEIKMDQTTSL